MKLPLLGLIVLLSAFFSCQKDLSETPGLTTAASVATFTTESVTEKYIKVNLYGGTNPYSNSEWNNWSTSTSASGNFHYNDGSASTVNATLSQNAVSDNGASYTATMAPAEVVRYSSYSTSNRSLSFSGLDDAKTYDLEIYSSRSGATNNTTRFVIGPSTVDVKTDNNLANKASFTALSSSSGKLTVSISKLNTYNYVNGFMLTEKTSGTVVVTPPTSGGQKLVKVNLFGGTNPFTSTEWNNWNTSATSASGNLKYSDGTASTVNASVSQNAVTDNGASYAATLAPQEVIRYASYSTSSRTLTISGLDNSKKYDLELYASRSGVSNNTTRFTIGTQAIDIKTDNNLTKKAAFTGLVPSSGKILVTIDKLNTYDYLNGFILTEGSTATATIPPVTVPSGSCNAAAPAVYTLTPATGTEIYIPDASSRGWKGGDTLRIPAGNYTLLDLGNFRGDACRPIVIINYGGQVQLTQIRIINDASYFKLTGTGDSRYTYGFKVSSAANAGVAIDLAHDVEVTNIEVTGTEVGLFFKKQPDASEPLSLYPNYVLSNYYIHNNYIHDTHGEGMYIGHTYPDADPYNNNLIPIRMDKIEIANNIVDGTDWDGIQLSNARTGAKIHDNTVTNFGRINMGSQQAGIILGGNTNGDIYNNVVKNGTGNGIEAYGYGLIKVYNNDVENAGADGTSMGQESIFCSDPVNQVESNPKQQIQCYNNTIKNPRPKGAIRVGSYFNNSLPSTVINNTVYLAGAPSNWLSLYVVANAVGSTLTGNVLGQ
jgi:Right handed beta helix region